MLPSSGIYHHVVRMFTYGLHGIIWGHITWHHKHMGLTQGIILIFTARRLI
jgi:sulfite exporter TauE/SafE